MKKLIFILLVCFASGLAFSQASGIRIGGIGSSGKVNVTAEGEAITGYVIYDENSNALQSETFTSTNHKMIDMDNLPEGAYFIAFVSESGDVVTKTYFKQED